ncbi:hypothetical protein ALC60_04245 [Trachymyrmex zeteki]|uniref:Gustatory receptor n=1 Tax=Mycetomoellerius zeteki TaxID=64791 RepID=A0A151X8E3_9HYME|nr:hypothetical protein ALC60_04245 [Trachymyrmex zeteki]
MTKTLQKAMAPLLIIGSFCSLGLFEYPLGQPRPYLSYLYALVTWSLFTFSVDYPYPIYLENWETVTDWKQNIIFISVITSIFVSWFRFKELKMSLHELSKVDDTLEALGAPKKYQRLLNWIIQIIIGWIVYIFSDFAVTIYWQLLYRFDLEIVDIYILFVENYPGYVIIFSVLICGTILGYTSFKFHQVNDRLHVLYFDIFENNADYRRRNGSISVCQRIIKAKDPKQYIWILM